MPTFGVNIAIFKSNQILLTKRHDFEVWCLPGGILEANETFTQAAIREANEEVGLDVRLISLVGIYERPNWRQGSYHILLFTAEIIGGQLTLQPDEVIDAQFFPRNRLPEDLLVGQRHRIHDAFNHIGGSVVTTEYPEWHFPPDATRQDIYDLCEQSGLSRRDFYKQHHPDLKSDQITIQIPGQQRT